MSFTEPQITMPADEDIIVDGVMCGVVKYDATSRGYLFANLELMPEAEGRLLTWPEIKAATRGDIYVTTRGGSRQRILSLEHASSALVNLHAREELRRLSMERDKLVNILPTADLNALIQKAYERLHNSYSRHATVLASIKKAVQAVCTEFERITISDPLELILEELLAERLGGWSLHSHNRDVLEQLELLVLRGAGEYVEVPSLEEFYREKLKAAKVTTLAEFCDVDLHLKLEDFAAVSESDEEIDWAPLEIPYPDGLVAPKNEADPKLKVNYAYKGEGEQRQAAACVVIPLSAFNPKLKDREEAKARKRALIAAVAEGSLLPALPHDHLKWWIRIEGEQKSAEGFQGEALAAQLRNLPAR